MKMNKKGFTLIEMLVVIAIIAVLVAIVVPTVSKSTEKSKAAADAANLRTIAAEAAIDYLDNDKLDNTYTATCKTFSNATIAVYKHDKTGEIKAVYVVTGDNAGNYDVASFAAVADQGGTPAAANLTDYSTVPVATTPAPGQGGKGGGT